MMMDALPQDMLQTKKTPYVFFVENSTTAKNSCYQMTSTTLPSTADVKECVQNIQSAFVNGFQWSDLPMITKITMQFLEDRRFVLNVDQRKTFLDQVLDETIHYTEISLLPDSFSPLLFKEMVPPLVNIMICDSLDHFLSTVTTPDQADDQVILATADSIVSEFTDVRWEDLAAVIELSIQFANNYESLPLLEKSNVAKKMVDRVVQQMDASQLPKNFIEPIFTTLSHSIIDEIFSRL